MAVVLQTQGTVSAVTTGNLSVTLPAYVANDIVVITTAAYIPNTTTGTNTQSLASPWTKYTPAVTTITGGIIDTEHAFWWARATSSSSLGTTVSITRPTSWDTGNDTAWGGRAYVIRGCLTTGNPFDQLVASALSTASNPPLPAVTVSGVDRLVIAFYVATDNLAAPTAATGYTVGTAATDATGTDIGFQSYTDLTSTSLTAVTPSGGATSAQNYQVYFSASFAPEPATLTRTATGSGTGTQTGVDLLTAIRTATGSGVGSQTAAGARVVERTATESGTGTQSATALVIPVRTATGSGVGTQTAVGLAPVKRTATGSGTGTQTATGTSFVVLRTVVQRAGLDNQDGNWTNSAGNNTDIYTYVDDVWNTFDGGFARGATDTTDISTSGQLHMQLSSALNNSSVWFGKFRSGRIRFRWRAANRVDDTVTLQYAFTGSTGTVVLGATSSTYMSTEITSTTFVDSGWIDFTYVNTEQTINITPFIRMRQVITANGAADGTWIEIDAFETEVTYTRVIQVTAAGDAIGNSVSAITASSFIAGISSGAMYSGNNQMLAQGLTPDRSTTIESASFYISRTGLPTGMVYARLYASSGPYTSGSSQPTTLLATSEGIDISTMSTSKSWRVFRFVGANKVTLSLGTSYFIAFTYSGGNASNNLSYAREFVFWATTPSTPKGSNNDGVSWFFPTAQDIPYILEGSTATGSVTPLRTATGSGLGTQTATGSIVTAFLRSATGSGTGTESASYLVTPAVRRTATGSGVGTQSATGLVTRFRTATGSGTGTESATGFKTVFRTAVGSGAGTSTADTLHNNIRSASGSGGASPNAIAFGFVTAIRTALGSGSSGFDSTGLRTVFRNASGSGLGFSVTVSNNQRTRTATGSGLGSGFTITTVTKLRSATGSGLGAAQVYWAITQSGMKFSYWGSNLMLT